MQLVRTSGAFPYSRVAAGSVVTIGAFDGLHLGHRQLLDRVLAEAADSGHPSVVMSFEPTPKEFFSAAKPPARLMRFREKYDALKQAGVDIFFCPRFNEQMKNIDAASFIRQLLIHTLNMKHLVIGDDFHFARNREGSLDQLRRVSGALEFAITQVGSVVVEGERVSSTAIREALWSGAMSRAARLLGGNYRMSGKVIRGQCVGRKLGYPTANVNLQRRQSAVMGIFAVRVHGLSAGPLDGVASVGTRPTFAGQNPLLEVHLFDFDQDIYGRYIQVEFVERLRSEKKFATVEELVQQMHLDSGQARAILAA